MTLIVGTIGPEFASLLADRRLSSKGRLLDDDYGKIGYLQTADSAMLFAFTGVARNGSFVTYEWLIDHFVECANDEIFCLEPMLHRLSVRATRLFSEDARITGLPDKRLSVVFCGFMGNGDPAASLVSNFETVAVEPNSVPVASNDFTDSHMRVQLRSREASAAFTFGNQAGLTGSDLKSLVELRTSEQPLTATKGKSISLLHKVAASPGSKGTVGKRYLFASLPSPMDGAPPSPTSSYGSDVQTDKVWTIDAVFAQRRPSIFMQGIHFHLAGGPKPVGQLPNAPCSCGSGLRFRHCHGRGLR